MAYNYFTSGHILSTESVFSHAHKSENIDVFSIKVLAFYYTGEHPTMAMECIAWVASEMCFEYLWNNY